MRIEQRIGRVDRRGQASETVRIVNIITPGTVDADIYSRCLLRIGIFERVSHPRRVQKFPKPPHDERGDEALDHLVTLAVQGCLLHCTSNQSSIDRTVAATPQTYNESPCCSTVSPVNRVMN